MRFHPVMSVVSVLFMLGCQGAADIDIPGDEEAADSDADALGISPGAAAFSFATFGGNGRTCLTCHSSATGTLSPDNIQDRFSYYPNDPLFRPIDSDDGIGNSYSRLLSAATNRVTIPLPAGVTLADDPSATTVTLERGIPTTQNTPALDPVLMLDARAPNLEAQASDAIHTHAQSTVEPTAKQLSDIANFEKTLFSNNTLKQFAQGGPAPTLPLGKTASEQRGRKAFETVPFIPPSSAGFCSGCHDGPMLNTLNQFNLTERPPGGRFSNSLVSQFNARNLPLITFIFTDATGSTTVSTPDPGRALITGNVVELNDFKITSLWGVRRTAPYFHDNSAETLEDVVAHYDRLLRFFTNNGLFLPAQDQADIVAYMKLL